MNARTRRGRRIIRYRRQGYIVLGTIPRLDAYALMREIDAQKFANFRRVG